MFCRVSHLPRVSIKSPPEVQKEKTARQQLYQQKQAVGGGVNRKLRQE